MSPVPLIALKVPPVTVTSPDVPFQAKLVLGSSLNVKVMVAVSPDFKVVLLLEINTVGAIMSILIKGVKPARPLLPAKS